MNLRVLGFYDGQSHGRVKKFRCFVIFVRFSDKPESDQNPDHDQAEKLFEKDNFKL